jgi:ribosomal-protein-alanine N-acetyltransferase
MNISKLFSKFPTLQTERLILRQVNENDLSELHELNNDPDVIKNINEGAHFTPSESFNNIVNFFPRLFNNEECITWGIALKENNELIGIRRCYVDSSNEPVTIQGQIRRKYRNKNYTFEAYIEIIKFLRIAEVKGIKANTTKDNLPAINLLKKLGFEEQYLVLGFFNPFPNTILFKKDLENENTEFFSPSYRSENINDFESAYSSAQSYLEEGELSFALKSIDRALSSRPKSSDAYYLKGLIVRKLRGNAISIECFSKAIDFDKNNSKAFRELGICLFNIANYDSAKEYLEIASNLGDIVAKNIIADYFKN